MIPPPPRSPLFPYTTLFRSAHFGGLDIIVNNAGISVRVAIDDEGYEDAWAKGDRKSTRLNSSHPSISYAVFCLKKKIRRRRGAHRRCQRRCQPVWRPSSRRW